MAVGGRKSTNELEFQGQVLEWLNEELRKRPGLALDRTTQEKPRKTSGKRSDLVIWKDRAAEFSFLTIELKTPQTPINDPVLFSDGIEKAKFWRAPYFVIWNMQEAELYQTPPKGGQLTPADAIKRWPTQPAVSKVEDWLRPDVAKVLRSQAISILEAAWGHSATGGLAGHSIDAEIFVTRLSDSVGRLREILYKEIVNKTHTDAKIRRQINTIASEQGFKGFVEDVELAIAGQIGYRLIGQILFYFAFRRKQPSLPALTIHYPQRIPEALLLFWNEVRRYDYEALFRTESIDKLVAIPDHGQVLLRTLIEHLAAYDWASLTDDVLGAIFERLIPRGEQILLGQFYTPRHVADLLIAITIDGERPRVLDPGCGSGTFLMSAYDYLASRAGLKHKDLLPLLWGFDLSPFAAELAAINLFRQDLSEFNNFPRIVPGNFFDRAVGQPVDFPPPRISGENFKKIPVPIPHFECIVGNPPYLRSQNQDDLDDEYRTQLFTAAARVGVKAQEKSDLFAFFIYHGLKFMNVGSRLGFVTPASWLTSDYASALQNLLLGELRLVAVVSSSAESFFPQVDVNTVLLIAEKIDVKSAAQDASLCFVTLKQTISKLSAGKGNYWDRMVSLADQLIDQNISFEDDRVRIKVIRLEEERTALNKEPTGVRNWSKYLRAPLSYYELFGDAA